MAVVKAEPNIGVVGEGELIYVPRNDAVAAEVTADSLIVTTRDGRTVSAPLAWFPFLTGATEQQRQNFQVLGTMILWDALDDFVSMEVLLLGRAGT